MTTKLILLSLVATCFGQLIYPDDRRIKTTAVPMYVYSTNMYQPASINSQAPKFAPAPQFAPVPQFTQPPQFASVPQFTQSPQFPQTPQFTQFSQFPQAPQFLSVPRLPEEAPLVGASASSATRPQTTAVPTDSKSALQDWDDHVNKIITNGILKFSLDLEREIFNTRGTSVAAQRENIIFSPISLAATLAIVLAGSAGRTFEDVARVLGFEAGVDISKNSEIVHQMFGLLMNQLHNEILVPTAPRTDFALASYVQEGYPLLQQFKTLSNTVYKNEVINIDFARNGRGAQQTINAWVKEKTMGKIATILDSVPPPETTVILLSALYFNGEWNTHFIEDGTKRKPFFVEPNEQIEIDMMYNGAMFPFYEDKQLGAKILALPYKGKEISMYVLLPTARGARALRAFQNKLSVDVIENLIMNMKNETCIIGLPRMKLSSNLSLRSTLARLGLISLFDSENADLSLMSQPQSSLNNVNNQSPLPTMMAPAMTVPPQPTMQNVQPTIQNVQPMMQNVQPTNNANARTNTNTAYDPNNVLIFSRFGGHISNQTKTNRVVKRNYFTYEDKVRDYSVEQWSNGFSLSKNRVARETKKEDRNTYTTKSESRDHTKVVKLEENKYRFEDKKERSKRQSSRPIDQSFLEFLKQKNFPSYGLDKLRNSGQLVNPHLFASDVLHKVEIDITEKGTEAAAVTSVTIERDGSQKRLLANRPFIFFIRHDPTRLVLFWGTVNTPTPHYPAT